MISNKIANREDDGVATLVRTRTIDQYFCKAQLTPGYFVNAIKRAYNRAAAPVRSFIVHGHDDELVMALQNCVKTDLGWPSPVVLSELPSATKTIIEKFEDQALDNDVVFVLLTTNDKGPRPNVLIELGFFLAKFGRRSGRLFVLKTADVEIPSDLGGVTYVDISAGLQGLGARIRRELPYYFGD